ncbi:MAG: sigma-70 family RNA polymerase sigma factor [Planctomycetota bacterium]
MKPASEFAELVALARQGHVGAMNTLFAQCRDYLLLIANQDLDERLQGQYAPSDLVQATMARANERFDQFQGTCQQELLGWFRTILKNEMRGTVRKELHTEKRAVTQERQGNSSWLAGSAAHPIDPYLTPASNAEVGEEAARLRSAMLKLSEVHRQVLLLRNWQRYSFAEIANRMQRSENAVKKLWARALVALEQELAE